MEVRRATTEDSAAWLKMRQALWPEGASDHPFEIASYFAGRLRMPLEVLLAFDDAGLPVGFVELSIRPYAEGCDTDAVAYLEGWFVVPEARCRGVGRALIQAAEQWARGEGCSEFASDALLDNEISAAAHRALGFTEVVQIRCFKKPLLNEAE
ncbi:MAG TPA: aminoglycoside 6'-N-acetyltransferase [Candidatus Acidoferrum sp.]|nr:aminoglycoside 6'-N-acetyltransferase [Candidatus Acidoferrum sp.]HXJ30888.1 aminoglycoside 6'-N-acetyltransferase [Gemmatimonadales bacterium]